MDTATDEIVLSTTAFNDAAACLKRYHYRWVEHLIPRPSEVKSVMRRGTWIHRCLELTDKGKAWLPELDAMAQWALDNNVPEEDVQSTYNEVRSIVFDYIAYWEGHEEYPGPYETIATEIPFTWTPRKGRTIKATLDRIVKDKRGRLWVWERKSTGEIPPSTWRAVDPQTLFQLVVAKQEGYDVRGVVFDYVLTEPGPAMRVKQDGRFYAGLDEKSVTSRAFAEAEQLVRERWKATDSKGKPVDTWPSADAYLNAMRVRMVNDGRWFQRYVVERPQEAVMETMKDVAEVMKHIKQAQESGHWPRSLNVFTCRRFCQYAHGDLCLLEYQTGRPSYATRQEFYVIEDADTRGEGRSAL